MRDINRISVKMLLKLVLVCLSCHSLNAQEIGSNSSGGFGNGKERTKELSINHKPKFTDCENYQPTVKEAEKRGTFVIAVHADDQDPIGELGGKVSYNIVQRVGQQTSFTINSTGEIFTDKEFDRDEPSREKEIYVTVQATDNGRPPLADICTFKVTITDINDNAPIIDQAIYEAQASEDLREASEVARIFAYDIDDGDNSKLTYSFAESNNNFRIDNATGVVYLNHSLVGKLGERYVYHVKVHDNGIPQREAETELSIVVVGSGKKAPSITSSAQTITVDENLTDFEKVLVEISAESNIDDKSLIFSLMRGKTIQTNSEQTFVLNQNTKTSADITLARSLDYETVTEYQLTVTVQNKDSISTSINIVVKVNDVNDEIPSFIEPYSGSIVENDEIGAQAVTVRAIDKDGTFPFNDVKYEILTFTDQFDIDPTTGVMTAKQKFDRESYKSPIFYVTVRAYDGAPSSLFRDKLRPNSVNTTFKITIEDQNDNKPNFEKAVYVVDNISEKANLLKDVIEVKANDNDTASFITYSIIEGNINDAFMIEATTGRIKVNSTLDYEKIESYNLTVEAFDGIYKDTAKVIIYILNENDELPVFYNYNKIINIEEERIPEGCIITLAAYDPDIKDRLADQKIIYRVLPQYKSFLEMDKEEKGCVKLTKKLDRDVGTGGYETWQAFIYAYDNDGGSNSLPVQAEIDIMLTDINDNAPFLDITEIVWYENQNPGPIVPLTAIDYDSEKNGPPFTFAIQEEAYSIREKFSIENGSVLTAKVTFDREEQKFYLIPILVTDSGTPPNSAVSTLKVIIGDRNDNAAQDGDSEIFVYKYEGLNKDIAIGRVFVEDLDDWDLPDKVFQWEARDDNFALEQYGGMINMKKDALPGNYALKFSVTEEHLPQIERHTVYANVNVTIKLIPKEAVLKSGSIRLEGATIEEFIQKDPITMQSKKDVLQIQLSRILNASLENVDVFTVLTPTNSTYVDVRFSAHGSPYYAPERLNNKATQQQEELERELGVKIMMISINECIQDGACPPKSSCSNKLVIEEDPAVVFTNRTSFVGVQAITRAECDCVQRIPTDCASVDDPNCQLLSVGFNGNGWAMYPTFDSCNSTAITLNVLPQNENGLIFYAGPLSKRQAAISKDFISLELQKGVAVLKVDLGYGLIEVRSKKTINDGAQHKIKISFTTDDVQIEIDDSSSDYLTWQSFGTPGLLNLNGPLQVGGRTNFPDEEAKEIWDDPPTTRGFVGCISNFTYNSYMYSLGIPSDSMNAHVNCQSMVAQAITFGIDSNFLVAILVCIAILLILLLAVVVHKRRQDNHNEKDMDDTRENIINYEDEGGGECDTQFDLSVFRPSLDEKPPMRDNLYKQNADGPADIGSFLDHKKHACDKDNLPYDDVRHYGYEGDGNTSASSLSSLASCTDEGDLKFNYLSSFGPRFRKLADMYGDDASEEGSQNGGEESWC